MLLSSVYSKNCLIVNYLVRDTIRQRSLLQRLLQHLDVLRKSICGSEAQVPTGGSKYSAKDEFSASYYMLAYSASGNAEGPYTDLGTFYKSETDPGCDSSSPDYIPS